MAIRFFSKSSISSILLALAAISAANGQEVDYSTGVFVVNEDWYGHQNSTVNYLLPDDPDGDYWHYRVIQTENPGIELGCTNQYGAIWNGRFYFIAKQDKDPGATVTGGRITVADAENMKVIKQLSEIDPSGRQCDGRAFVGVDAHKGYVSTSNGIWILDLDKLQITGQISGTENPNFGDDKPNSDPTGSLYHGQTGTMVLVGNRVFAAHQQYGLLVINAETDRVETVISLDFVAPGAGIGSIVKARNGSLWVSVAQDVSGTGLTLPYLVHVNPETLECETVPVTEGTFPPSNSWYAWTPDAFCASTQSNSLYWCGGENTWFSGQMIFKMDVDTRKVEKIVDLQTDGEGWKVYGCSMRVDPVSDYIFTSLYHEFGQPTYITRTYDSNGVKIKDYPMISNYWFPSLFVFPQGLDDTGGLAEVEADAKTAEYYDIKGNRLMEQPARGFYILRRGSTVTKHLK